jgi:hypothetical protein
MIIANVIPGDYQANPPIAFYPGVYVIPFSQRIGSIRQFKRSEKREKRGILSQKCEDWTLGS